MDTLAVFRSRSEALRIYNKLKNKHIACAIINTPSKLGVGCGISLIFSSSVTEKVQKLITEYGAVSFVGFFHK